MATVVAVVALIVAVGSAIYAANQAPDDQGGRQLTKQGSQNARNRIYGTCIVGCTNVYTNVSNRDQSFRTDVFAVGGIGPVKFHNIWIEDKKMFSLDKNDVTNPTSSTDGMYTSASMNPAYQKSKSFSMQWRSGQENQVAASLAINNSDGEFGSSCRGALVPTIVINADFSDDQEYVIFGDRYQIEALVTAEDIFDVRTGSVNGKSSNPSLAIYDFLTSTYFGLGVPSVYIDIESFKHVANRCDANNLEINSAIDGSSDFSQTLQDMLSTFGGSLSIHNGKIQILFEDIELTSLYSFDEDNIISNSFNVRPDSSSNYYNVVSATFKSHINAEKQDDFVIPSDASDRLSPEHANHPTRIYKDGEIITKTIDLPFTIDAYKKDNGAVNGAVKFLVNREYNRAKFQTTCTFDIDLLSFPALNIWSVIDITHSVYGWDKKKFRVQSMVTSTDQDKFNIATVTLSEYSDEIYSGTNDGNVGKPLPTPKDVQAPIDFKFVLQSVVYNGFGTLSWTPKHFTQSTAYDIEYKISSENNWTRLASLYKGVDYKIYSLKLDDYDFRVRTNDNILGVSDWVILEDQTVNVGYTLPAISNLVADATTTSFIFNWDDALGYSINNISAPSDPDAGGSTGTVRDVFAHYKVNIYKGTSHGIGYTLLDTFTTTDNTFSFTLDDNQQTTNGPHRFIKAEVVIVSNTGQESTSVTTVNSQNSQMPAPSGVSVDGEFGNMAISWINPNNNGNPYPDFFVTEIHESTTNNFTPSSSTLIGTVAAGVTFFTKIFDDNPSANTHYIRIVHRDVFNPIVNLNYSAQYTFTFKSIDDLLPEFANELTDIRNPAKAATSTGEMIMNVASPNKKTVTGFGMYASDNDQGNGQSRSRFIVAADEFVVAAGGYAEWQSNISYSVGERVVVTWSDTLQTAYVSLTNGNANHSPSRGGNNTYWTRVITNTFQSALYFNSTDEKLYLREAVIETVNATKINAGTLNANVILASSINGNQIKSNTTFTAGTVANKKAYMSGVGTYRFWAGHDTPTSAPFSVSETGAVNASNLNITGGSISVGARFSVTNDGTVTANYAQFNNAKVNGEITATKLTAGGSASTNWRAVYGYTPATTGSPAPRSIGVYGEGNGSGDGDGVGVIGVANVGVGVGVRGNGSQYDFYAEGSGTNYGPFTGGHDGLLPITTPNYEVGDIVCDIKVVHLSGVSNAICEMTISNKPNQKSARGVFVSRTELNPYNLPAALDWTNEDHVNLTDVYDRISFNALGEGAMNVCGEGGDMEIGDLIVTSSIAGKGMRQSDDIMRSITVAEVRENVKFDSPDQVKMVAVIYHCG